MNKLFKEHWPRERGGGYQRIVWPYMVNQMDNNKLKKLAKELKARARREEKLARLEAMREKAEANKLPDRKQRPRRRKK